MANWITGSLFSEKPTSYRIPQSCYGRYGSVYKRLMRQKHGRRWEAIQNCGMQAIGETLTAAIPIDHMREKNETVIRQASSDKYIKLAEEIIHERFPVWCSLLNQTTGNGKGLPTVTGGCGAFVPTVVRSLH